MHELQIGDKIKVTFEATVEGGTDSDGDYTLRLIGDHVLARRSSTAYLNKDSPAVVEVVRRAVASDPYGTIRKSNTTGNVFIKIPHRQFASAAFEPMPGPWVQISNGFRHDDEGVRRWNTSVIGFVPGTDADSDA